ncbi:MAG: hypothetical protein H6673_14780 [Anaerolineales bacterium]|nr:hypothetical protein [Anaerolineales bacterium]
MRRLPNPFRLIARNPVALKELRGRMRGPRAFIVLTGYLIVVAGFTVIIYLATTEASLSTTGEVDGGTVGRFLFNSVVAMELFLVTFITPAFTASAISGEHEHQTYDLLRTTLLPERSLVWGKLFSTLAYVMLLLLAAIPLQSIAFLFGGVDLPEIYIAFVTLFATTTLLGTLGVYFSATTRRTLKANIFTYVSTMGLVVITAMAVMVLVSIEVSRSFGGQNNITVAGEWVLLLLRGVFVCLNPLTTLLTSQDYLINQQSAFSFVYTFSDGSTVTLPSPWIVYSIAYMVLSALIFWRTVRVMSEIEE